MGITFYVSHNSRYFLGLEGREAFLMRENRDIWRTRIPFTNFQIAGVGNLGRVVVRAEEGVFRAEPAPVPKFEEIPIFGSSVLKQENAHLGRVVLNATGDRLMVEKISRKSKLGDKIIKMISSSPVQKGQFIHDLVLYSLESKKRVLVFRSSADRRLPHAFYWNVSPSFGYGVWSEARKKFREFETKFSIVDLSRDQIFMDFTLEGLAEWNLLINNLGTVLVDSPQTTKHREILVCNSAGEKFKVTVDREFDVNHLGRGFVSFRSRMRPFYLFKSFDDQVLEEISLEAVEEMELDYSVVFNQDDDIDFVARKDNNIKFVHTSSDRFSIDARRWRMMVDQMRIDEEIASHRGELEQRQTALREQQSQLRARELLKSVMDEKEERARLDREQIRQMQVKLGDLKDQYKARMLSRYEYLQAKKELDEEIRQLQEKLGMPVTAPEPPEPEPIREHMPHVDPYYAAETQFIADENDPEQGIEEVFDQVFVNPAEPRKPIPLAPMPGKKPRLMDRESLMPSPGEEIPGQVFKIPASELKLTDEDLRGEHRGSLYTGWDEHKKIFSPLKISIRESDTDEMEKKSEFKPMPFSLSGLTQADDDDSVEMPGLSTGQMKEILESTVDMVPSGTLPREGNPVRSEPEKIPEDTTRLLQMRKQIEQEIQKAVSQKKRTAQKIDKILSKYQKLLEELEESYRMGVISRENYLKMRSRYEERLRKVQEEFGL